LAKIKEEDGCSCEEISDALPCRGLGDDHIEQPISMGGRLERYKYNYSSIALKLDAKLYEGINSVSRRRNQA
jgi:hypothetical protein